MPDDIVEHDSLIYTGRVVADWQFRSGRRLVSVRPKGRLRSDSGEAIIQWALAGLGLAMVPTFLIPDHIESGALVPLLLDYPTPSTASSWCGRRALTSRARCAC